MHRLEFPALEIETHDILLDVTSRPLGSVLARIVEESGQITVVLTNGDERVFLFSDRVAVLRPNVANLVGRTA